MKTVYIIAGFLEEIPDVKGDLIGVDYGAYLLAKAGLPMVFAVGDFDSVPDMGEIAKYAKEVKKLNPVKDDSDLEEAVLFAKERYDRMIVYGALGGRIDHEISALRLITQHKEPMEFVNAQNRVFRLDDGEFEIEKGNYTYLSFFALKESEITLEGVKYPLEDRVIVPEDLYLLSNEILGEKAKIKLNGAVLAVQSNDNKKHR